VAVYHANLGGSYRALGRWEEAEKAYSAALELESDNAQYHDMLGYVYYKSGDYDRAAEKCSEAIRISPGVPTYASHLVLACGKIDNPEKAKFLLESASKYNPDNIDLTQAIERLKERG
jgi:tetratricopeptide (TPR) repeat protein